MLVHGHGGSLRVWLKAMNRSTGLTIGNFDGVHRGHAELVRAARSAVGESGRVVVLSFDPHPVSVLRPESTPQQLTSFHRRRHLLLAAGADDVIALSPTRKLLGQQANDFIRFNR
jgi:riboflavin kinase / FMN adenylyltransferase